MNNNLNSNVMKIHASKISGHLRSKAEALLSATKTDLANMNEKDILNVIHELQLYQIELTMQNEELLNAQQELQETHNRYFHLYNFAPAGYLTINKKGIIIEANMIAGEILAMEIEEIKGKKITSLITADGQDNYYLHTQSLLHNQKTQYAIAEMYKGDGTVIIARIDSKIYTDDDGNQTQHSVFLDVTNCSQIQTDLDKTVMALTRSNTELERFAYVASHDLREPLRNISSCTQLLEMKYKDALGTDGQQLLNYTLDSVQHMNNLISDLLSYSRQGENTLRFETVDCGHILTHVLDNTAQLITDNEAIITSDSLPTIQADSTQISQLFQNLISNAIKHHPHNKQIKIHISAQKRSNYWLFFVKDNGGGIDNAYLEKIFEIFQKLDTKSKYHGTGIGLSICQRVVEQHSGRIWVESSIGEGSCFCFTLPEKASA